MSTTNAVFSNYARLVIEGQVDLDDDGTVLDVRGDGLSCVKGTSGAYTLVYANPDGLALFSVLKAEASVMDGSACATVRADISAVTRDSNTGAISVSFSTHDGTSAADEDTAALTLNFEVVVQTANMSNPL